MIDILALTSDRFVEAAAAIRVPRDDALSIYRRWYRSGPTEHDWIAAPPPDPLRVQEEAGTRKFIQRLPDGLETESVILPQTSRAGRTRNSLCVSSQIGCAMGCMFCETGQMGLMANLTTGQIVAQWHAARFALDTRITNVVFMGMGEPMDNLDAVIPAIEVLVDRNGPAVPASAISVSTVGRVDGIARLAELARRPGYRQLRLAVSLNAPNDRIRNEIMPVNRSAPMSRLMEAMLAWPAANRLPLLIEYVLIPGVNDQLEHVTDLCDYLAPLSCSLNVIPYNPRRDSPWPAPTEDAVDRFVAAVRECGQFVTRRRTMGRTLMAACGQLGNADIRRRRFTGVRVDGECGSPPEDAGSRT